MKFQTESLLLQSDQSTTIKMAPILLFAFLQRIYDILSSVRRFALKMVSTNNLVTGLTDTNSLKMGMAAIILYLQA